MLLFFYPLRHKLFLIFSQIISAILNPSFGNLDFVFEISDPTNPVLALFSQIGLVFTVSIRHIGCATLDLEIRATDSKSTSQKPLEYHE